MVNPTVFEPIECDKCHKLAVYLGRATACLCVACHDGKPVKPTSALIQEARDWIGNGHHAGMSIIARLTAALEANEATLARWQDGLESDLKWKRLKADMKLMEAVVEAADSLHYRYTEMGTGAVHVGAKEFTAMRDALIEYGRLRSRTAAAIQVLSDPTMPTDRGEFWQDGKLKGVIDGLDDD